MPVRVATPEDARGHRVGPRRELAGGLSGSAARRRARQPLGRPPRRGLERRHRRRRAPADAVLLLERAGTLRASRTYARRATPTRAAASERCPSLYLRPEVWGQGLGRELMAAALSHLDRRGLRRRRSLWVLATNDRARRFYEAGGWEHDGVERTERIGGAPRGRGPLPAGVGNGAPSAMPDGRGGNGAREPARTLGRRLAPWAPWAGPRARSPTMLRWISAAPPQIVSEREKKYDDWMSSTG